MQSRKHNQYLTRNQDGENSILTSRDLLEFGEKVLTYTEGLRQEAFIADKRTYDVTLRKIELHREAPIHFPVEVRVLHPEVPRHAIIGNSNRLPHGYLHISESVIWSTIQDSIPRLVPALRHLVDTGES